MKLYRQGAAGALLDIYEQEFSGLKKVIEDIPDNALPVIRDTQTTDDECKSIQSILTHVVGAAYGYATYIDNVRGNKSTRPERTTHSTIKEYLEDLDKVFKYTENIFTDIKENELEQFDNSLKIKTRWGQYYDIEQMMEHAIVHVQRHKRQIEKMKSQLK